MRRLRLLIVAVVVLGAVDRGERAIAEHSGEAAERAAMDIQLARDRANAASQAMFDAESEIDTLALEIADSERRLQLLEVETEELRSGLETAAIRRFVGAGGEPLGLLTSIDSANDGGVADVFFAAASGTAVVTLDDFDASMTEVGSV